MSHYATSKYRLSTHNAPRKALDMCVLVVDSDAMLLSLMGHILRALDIKHILYADSGESALAQLGRKNVDLVISEWPMHVNGRALLRIIRTTEDRNTRIPFIISTTQSNPRTLFDARDAGMNAFLSKPLNISLLCKRIRTIIDEPRAFIQNDNYCGPSRRYKGTIPATGDKRIPVSARDSTLCAETGATIITLEKGALLTISPPCYKLKRKIGETVSLNDIFSAEAISKADALLDKAEEESAASFAADVKWLQQSLDWMSISNNIAELLPKMFKRLLALQSRASMFDYVMASQTAGSLHHYLQSLTSLSPKKEQVIAEHIDILKVVFHQKMSGHGGEQAKQIMMYLLQLKERYPS